MLQQFVAEAEQVLREAGGRTKAEIEPPKKAAPDKQAHGNDPYLSYAREGREGESFFKKVNALAMASLSSWVPSLFPTAKPYKGGYRVASKDLRRDNEEDRSILPIGIKDWGVWDEGDSQQGKRTPIDVVMEWDNKEATAGRALALRADGH